MHGTVVDQAGAPLVGASIALSLEARMYNATTDERGHYAFDEVAPGTYTVSFNFSRPSPMGVQQGSEAKQVVVSAGSDQRVDAKLQVTDTPMAMPYGAPPARRRVV